MSKLETWMEMMEIYIYLYLKVIASGLKIAQALTHSMHLPKLNVNNDHLL